MGYEVPPEVQVRTDGPVRIVTLNRPDKLNAVNHPLHHGFVGLWRQFQQDPEVRAVVVTGAGRAFCAGADKHALETDLTQAEQRRIMIDDGRKLVADMLAFPFPTIAAVNGPAAGVGCSIALLCDVVLMAEGAWIADSHVAAVGVAAGDGGAILWPLLTSLSRAKEYLLTGDRIPAEEAVRFGLALAAYPPEVLLEEAVALAHRYAALPPFAVQATKKALNFHLQRIMVGTFEYAISMETLGFELGESKDRVATMLPTRG